MEIKKKKAKSLMLRAIEWWTTSVENLKAQYCLHKPTTLAYEFLVLLSLQFFSCLSIVRLARYFLTGENATDIHKFSYESAAKKKYNASSAEWENHVLK